MKYPILFVLLSMLAVTVAGGGSAPTASAAKPSPESTAEEPAAEPAIVEDQASLVAALEAASATVELGDSVEQAFFRPVGQIIKVNGADVQVFEYESPEAMENEASQVAPDGGSIGTNMVMWMDTPHFYKAGRIIALYIGSDQVILSLRENALGSQFAGR